MRGEDRERERFSNRLICDHHHSSERAYDALEKFQFKTMATKRNLANEPEKEDIIASAGECERVWMLLPVSYGYERKNIDTQTKLHGQARPGHRTTNREMKNQQKTKEMCTGAAHTLGFLVGNKLTEKSIQQA